MSDLAIVLPGRGYTAIGPAIRFAVLAAEDIGYRSSTIDYPADAIRDQDVPAVVAAARGQIAAAIETGGVDRVVVIAKSLGTRVLVQTVDLLANVGELSVVWLTPLFGDEEVRNDAIGTGWRSLIVSGQSDPFHDPVGVAAAGLALDASVIELPDADHALEVPGDVMATIDGLRDVAVGVRRFLEGGQPST